MKITLLIALAALFGIPQHLSISVCDYAVAKNHSQAAGLSTASAETVNPLPRRFVPTDPIPSGTVAHSATVLPDGNILVTGGYSMIFDKIPLASNLARIFDAKTLKWRVARSQLHYGRLNHASIVLPASGGKKGSRVLIVGGISQSRKALKSIELFDLTTEKFQIMPSMTIARKSPRLSYLPNGRILITGQNKKAEIFEPCSSAPSGYIVRPTHHRSYTDHTDHAAVSMPDGSVILFGGRTTYIERFDPKTERFEPYKTRLPKVYDDQAAALLYDGTILLVGGQEVYSNKCTDKTWLFNPKTGGLSNGPLLTPQMGSVRFIGVSDVVAVDLLASDKNRRGRYILLCGGEDDPGKGPKPDIILDTAWVYDAVAGKVEAVGPMINPHDDFAAAVLPVQNNNAAALIIAGYKANDAFQANCEIFQFPVGP
ncbi:MAG: hypothetical protein K9M57_05565 [Phycisphaerae bacterium]|nr:hypothetical protein [Phycisphaerae bacterium]